MKIRDLLHLDRLKRLIRGMSPHTVLPGIADAGNERYLWIRVEFLADRQRINRMSVMGKENPENDGRPKAHFVVYDCRGYLTATTELADVGALLILEGNGGPGYARDVLASFIRKEPELAQYVYNPRLEVEGDHEQEHE